MKIKKVISLTLATVLAVGTLSGCTTGLEGITMTTANTTEEGEPVEDITFDAMLYDNAGNNYLTVKGKTFNIKPNKIKQWGYSTDGNWESWYETSSVVSIEIDNQNVESCGSSVIFKDSRIKLHQMKSSYGAVESETQGDYSVNVNQGAVVNNYFNLRYWWYDTHKSTKGGKKKVVLIQSQDGYNIGAIEGNKVSWEVSTELPKTTLLTIDKKPLYIHRCNFVIIDSELIKNSIQE